MPVAVDDDITWGTQGVAGTNIGCNALAGKQAGRHRPWRAPQAQAGSTGWCYHADKHKYKSEAGELLGYGISKALVRHMGSCM